MRQAEAPVDQETAGQGAVGQEEVAPRRSDLAEGSGWLTLGALILIGSLTMDRLQSQGVEPYAAPGLLPGLLGIVIILFGGLLTLRGWWSRGDRTALVRGKPAGSRRLAVVLGLCIIFGVGLVGQGLPFWAASALFVATATFVLQNAEQPAAERRLSRRIAFALVIGLGAGVGVTLVFQDLFLVRLP